jgi:hypothetical protein
VQDVVGPRCLGSYCSSCNIPGYVADGGYRKENEEVVTRMGRIFLCYYAHVLCVLTELITSLVWCNLHIMAYFMCVFYVKLLPECNVSYRAVHGISLLIMSFCAVIPFHEYSVMRRGKVFSTE